MICTVALILLLLSIPARIIRMFLIDIWHAHEYVKDTKITEEEQIQCFMGPNKPIQQLSSDQPISPGVLV